MALIEIFHRTLYRWLIMPAGLLLFFVLQFFIPKIRAGLKLRELVNGRWPWLAGPADTRPVWIHCASGEFEYAKPVVKNIKKKFPDSKIMVTYFSPSAQKAAENFPGVDLAVPLPWDHVWFFSSFLNHHRPKALLISRTDLWPEMVYSAYLFKIPILLFSATFGPQKTRLKNPLARLHTKWLLSMLSDIFCVAGPDRELLTTLTETPVTVSGDSRYDQVLERLKNPKPLKDQLRPQNITFVAGSTWPEDEDVIFPAFGKLLKNNVKVMVAPHEPTPSHIKAMQTHLSKLSIKSVLYSETEFWANDTVLLVDKVGILADLYGWAQLAFVGNSFKNHAVHSVMEPLGAGCLTFVGPKHHNNREALEFKKIPIASSNLHLVTEFESGDQFTRYIGEYLKLTRQPVQEKIRSTVQAKTGASEKIVSWLESM